MSKRPPSTRNEAEHSCVRGVQVKPLTQWDGYGPREDVERLSPSTISSVERCKMVQAQKKNFDFLIKINMK